MLQNWWLLLSLSTLKPKLDFERFKDSGRVHMGKSTRLFAAARLVLLLPHA